MVNRMRATRAHRDNRRSHHSLQEVRLSLCPNCKAMHIRHTLCENCGHYRGKKIIDVAKAIAKKAERAKSKQKELAK